MPLYYDIHHFIVSRCANSLPQNFLPSCFAAAAAASSLDLNLNDFDDFADCN
jgi:hypothetical protein